MPYKDKERKRENAREHYHANKEYIRARRKELYEIMLQDPDRVKTHRVKQATYVKKNKAKLTISNREYYYYRGGQKKQQITRRNSRDRINTKDRQRVHTDIKYRLGRNLRNRFRYALKKQAKRGSAIRDLGCSVADVKIWLEQQFIAEMTWDNYGTLWEVDHIIPMSRIDLTNIQGIKRACNWFNLRPLIIKDNRSRGNKLHDPSMDN